MKLGFIGSGSRGSYLIDNFSKLGVEIGAIYGHKNRGKYPGLAFTADIDFVIETSDAVVIATPTKTHFDLAMKVIDADLPLYLEKPITENIEKAIELERAVLDRGSIVMIAHSLCYGDDMPDFMQRKYLFGYARQYLQALHIKQNPYWEVGIHTVAVMDLLGIHDYGYELSINSDFIPSREIFVYCEDGQSYRYEPANYTANECQHFIDCIKNHVEPRTNITHARRVIEEVTARYGDIDSMVYF